MKASCDAAGRWTAVFGAALTPGCGSRTYGCCYGGAGDGPPSDHPSLSPAVASPNTGESLCPGGLRLQAPAHSGAYRSLAGQCKRHPSSAYWWTSRASSIACWFASCRLSDSFPYWIAREARVEACPSRLPCASRRQSCSQVRPARPWRRSRRSEAEETATNSACLCEAGRAASSPRCCFRTGGQAE